MAVGKDKKQILVVMPIEVAEELKAFADKQRRSVSQTALLLIEEGLAKINEKAPQDEKQAS